MGKLSILSCVMLLAIALPISGCKKKEVKVSTLTPEDAISVFTKAIIGNKESVFEQVYYAGDDKVIGDLIKKDFLARSRCSIKLMEIQGKEPPQEFAISEIKAAVKNSFMDNSILYVTLSQSNTPSDVIEDIIKSMRLSMTLPSEEDVLLLQKRGEQWFIVHPYIAWNRGFREGDIDFLKDRILFIDGFIRDMNTGKKTAEQILSEYKKLDSTLRSVHSISPFQW
jgi:hypothetical protein